jgi:hypothetical protein
MAEKSNKGFDYEDKIIKILKKKKLIPANKKRTGGSDNADIIVNFKSNEIIIELKNKDQGADYGQKELVWSPDNLWSWSLGKNKIEDGTVKLFKGLNIIENYINKDFKPRRYSKIKSTNILKSKYEDVSVDDYNFDRKTMEKPKIPIPLNTLFKYYELKDCFYIQIEKSGFYHLSKDKFNIGTKQFDGEIELRLRAKYRGSKKNIKTKPWDYGFLAKIGLKKKPTASIFDIQEHKERKFPFKD